MVLSVEEIVNGVDDFKEIEIESVNDTVFLRPLSKGEWAKVDSIRQAALGDYTTNEKAKSLSTKQRISNVESQLKFNIKENGDAEFKAQVEAIFLSMSNDGYDNKPTKESIKSMRPDVFDEIYEKVKEISGISDDIVLEDDVDEFPEN
ncbi:MAG: hypothetical protein IKF11_06245 [Methanobrevibacter sp.]|nr:hypothetical protein [Methanobrevibacter sp.]